jgi:hypothetical protein
MTGPEHYSYAEQLLDEASIAAKTTPNDLRAEERIYRALAARFEATR